MWSRACKHSTPNWGNGRGKYAAAREKIARKTALLSKPMGRLGRVQLQAYRCFVGQGRRAQLRLGGVVLAAVDVQGSSFDWRPLH
jgi:hypothetical protein